MDRNCQLNNAGAAAAAQRGVGLRPASSRGRRQRRRGPPTALALPCRAVAMHVEVLMTMQGLAAPGGCSSFERPSRAVLGPRPGGCIALRPADIDCPDLADRLQAAGPAPARRRALSCTPTAMRAHPAPQRAHQRGEGEGERRTLRHGGGRAGAADGRVLSAVQAPFRAGGGCKPCCITPRACPGPPGAQRRSGRLGSPAAPLTRAAEVRRHVASTPLVSPAHGETERWRVPERIPGTFPGRGDPLGGKRQGQAGGGV